ncbi:hypothetical protein R3P38DRAFT_3236572 [Favolaschia claudopus]|uniref:Uncharacterized protein n=1 Tax=Favolaschia claudopus TaxID=2862362 RepID=A0AAV9ZCH3_9AGAR
MSRQPSVETLDEPRELRPSNPLPLTDCIMRPVQDDVDDPSPRPSGRMSNEIDTSATPPYIAQPSATVLGKRRQRDVDERNDSAISPSLTQPSATALSKRRQRDEDVVLCSTCGVEVRDNNHICRSFRSSFDTPSVLPSSLFDNVHRSLSNVQCSSYNVHGSLPDVTPSVVAAPLVVNSITEAERSRGILPLMVTDAPLSVAGEGTTFMTTFC